MLKQFWKAIGRPATFLLDAEAAHGLSIKSLKTGAISGGKIHSDPRLSQSIAGLTFSNPVGVAAGLDKNAEVPDALLKLGFGFTEVGTITPLAQAGNPKPRIFRIVEDQAVINRLGFNNQGHEEALKRLEARAQTGLVGVNVGANKDSDDRFNDYVLGIEKFYGVASYFTANISSPNTPGLRDLQAKDQLAELLSRIMAIRAEKAQEFGRTVPVFLKIAPDVTEADLDDIVSEVLDKKLDGIIVSNTTLDRSVLQKPNTEVGGLSGKPLHERSTIMLAKTRQRAGKDLTIIGVGGVHNADSAADKFEAGADLIQLYTGMVYEGPTIANAINRGLSQKLDHLGLAHISQLRDRKLEEWAARTV
ncbi:quinone-dependent dihydroorotate dehydrogenase [Ahrensia sp. 13_GOM-1096m]|uniref:quinone-dependent dihydroorotate dehydrogenase n=1 Tax=Ahrensia sp. 13_GOM-1096m TaxID=1380380 RepID=UPI00047EBB6A|nr:quinone-dependent dihydroorotate dehydrogenase [Ahrensia sp. 13_GOM-1096m]